MEGIESGLVNANEELVKESVRKMMDLTDMCKCEKCFYDACAIVLNNMEPIYATTRKGAILSRLPQMGMVNQAEINVLIAQALKIVDESPMH